MSELLVFYAAFSLAAMPAPGANPIGGYIPFYDNYYFWKVIGFSGIGVFGTRFLVQWLYSEKHKESRVPPIFWWQSLIGTMLCLAYFVRQWDSVGIAGYVLNIIPYTRNLMLIHRKKRELARGLGVVNAGDREHS